MRASKTLPISYKKARTLDITKDSRLMAVMILGGFILLAGAGLLFFRAAFWLRPADSLASIEMFSIRSIVDLGIFVAIFVATLVGLTAAYIGLHEAVHGAFFWIFTGARPRFAVYWTHAYAAAPEWYIPRIPFLITTLAPLVFISLAGLFVLRYAPQSWLLPAWYILTMNVSGAIGDLLVAYLLLRMPPTGLVQDCGDVITFYLPDESSQKGEEITPKQ